MDPREYELVYRNEMHHWWYLGMQKISRLIIERYLSIGRPLKILDAGCGTGGSMVSFLSEYGIPTGIDISSSALEFCRKRGLNRVAIASVEEIPFPALFFDLITSFDVLYEKAVSDDARAMGEFTRLLVPGGYLLLRLPAYDWLRGSHDMVIHTARRYSAGQVQDILQRCGFQIRVLSYANTLLFLPALIKRLSDRLFPSDGPRSDLELPIGPLNGFLKFILSLEASFVARGMLPFGLSVIALGQKMSA